MRALAAWCVRHRRLVVTGWVVALIGLSAAGILVSAGVIWFFVRRITHPLVAAEIRRLVATGLTLHDVADLLRLPLGAVHQALAAPPTVSRGTTP